MVKFLFLSAFLLVAEEAKKPPMDLQFEARTLELRMTQAQIAIKTMSAKYQETLKKMQEACAPKQLFQMEDNLEWVCVDASPMKEKPEVKPR